MYIKYHPTVLACVYPRDFLDHSKILVVVIHNTSQKALDFTQDEDVLEEVMKATHPLSTLEKIEVVLHAFTQVPSWR